MTGAEALTLLMARLVNTNTSVRAAALLEMKLQQEQLENNPLLPWFLVSEDATTQTIPNERRVLLPSDFLREHDEGHLLVEDENGDWHELQKEDYDLLIDEHGFETTASLPTGYAIVGLYFCLFPIPDVARTLRLTKYFARDVAPTDDANTNKWLTHAASLLIAKTGIAVASFHLRDEASIPLFVAMEATAMSDLVKSNTAREEANRPRSMGEN